MLSNNYKHINNNVSECNYSPNYKNLIALHLYELSKSNATCKIFKIKKQNNKEIVGVKMLLEINFRMTNFKVPIIILIPEGFPTTPPEFYVEKTSDNLSINPENRQIDINTGRIYTNKMINWSENFSLIELIPEIVSSFEQNFPLFKTPSSTESVSSAELNLESLMKQDLINEIKKSVGSLLIKQMEEYKRQNYYLLKYREYFHQRINKVDNIVNTCKKSYFENYVNKMNKEIFELKQNIREMEEKIKLNSEDPFNLIKIDNDKILKIISYEATLEDFLNYVRKALDKQAINFTDSVKYIRTFSKELFKLKFIRNKYTSQII